MAIMAQQGMLLSPILRIKNGIGNFFHTERWYRASMNVTDILKGMDTEPIKKYHLIRMVKKKSAFLIFIGFYNT